MPTQLLYSCDDVFELLTRGPVADDTLEPSAQESLQRHLLSCHECRSLAEALRPATECIHEALAEEERTGLPQFVSTLPVVVKQDETPRRKASTSRLVMTTVATLLVATGVAAWFGGANESAAQQPSLLGAVDCLPSLELPDSCLENSASDHLIADCCTKCHQATPGRSMAEIDMRLLLKSCTACHQPPAPRNPNALSACNDCHDRSAG